MSNLAESRPADHSPKRPRRVPWQVGLRTLLLLMAVIAVWMTYYINRKQISLLESRITTARPLAHELVVNDPTQFAVVMKDQEWFDDHQWEVYLPAGRYRLCLATRGIDANGLATVLKSTPLEAGKHRLALDEQSVTERYRLTVSLDDTKELTVEEPKEWNPGLGMSGGGEYSLCTQLPANQPLVLFRRRFLRPNGTLGSPSSPAGPCEGVLIWIEREPGLR